MNNEPIIKEIVTLENSELRKIADRVVTTAILAAQKVSVEQGLKPAKESFEAIMLTRIKSFDPKKMKAIKEKVTPLYNAPIGVRTALYGELGKIDLKKTTSVEAAVRKLEPVKINLKLLGLPILPKGVDLTDSNFKKQLDLKKNLMNFQNITGINAITGSGLASNQSEGMKDDADVDEDNYTPQAVTDKLGLYISRIKCVDETGSSFEERWGSDEIALAGVSVDEDGDTKKINEHYVGGGFDDGDSKNYRPHWQWYWFNMREGNIWPKSYFLTFILIEKDNGGAASFIQTMWDKVKKEVMTALSDIGSTWGPLGTVIGAAVSYAVGKIVEWFINLWNDDIFRPKTISCTVPAYSARWTKNGKWGYTTSPVIQNHFTGHDGHYFIEYYWRLFS